MSLKWVRLDAGFPHNQKVLTLVEQGCFRAVTVYVCGLAYSGSQGLDGWVPSSALAAILHMGTANQPAEASP